MYMLVELQENIGVSTISTDDDLWSYDRKTYKILFR